MSREIAGRQILAFAATGRRSMRTTATLILPQLRNSPDRHPRCLRLIVFIIFVALVFDFLNGFHDAANSIATIVSTRVLTPTQAVIWAAFFNFVAAFVFGTKVAETIGKGLVDIRSSSTSTSSSAG